MALEPGWYPDQVDRSQLRYWDGSAWTSSTAPLPPAPAGPSTGQGRVQKRKRERRRRWPWLIGGSVVLALAVVGTVSVAVFAGRDADVGAPVPPVRDSDDRSASAPQEADKFAQEADKVLEADGWTVWESGNLYIRPAESGTYSCGPFACIAYWIGVVDGCPNALYIEASIMRDGVVIGYTNDRLGAIEAKGSGFAVLQDVSGEGDAFGVSKVSCY